MDPHGSTDAGAETREMHVEKDMNVVSPAHDVLGRVRTILVDEDTEQAQFLVIDRKADGQSVLVPVEIVEATQAGELIADASPEVVSRLPRYDPDYPPTRDQIEQTCQAVGVEVVFEEV